MGRDKIISLFTIRYRTCNGERGEALNAIIFQALTLCFSNLMSNVPHKLIYCSLVRRDHTSLSASLETPVIQLIRKQSSLHSPLNISAYLIF